MSEVKTNAKRALIACSLWLHIGFVGAAVLAVGLIRLFDGDPASPAALPMVLFGGMLAAASWRRSLTVLEHAERASAIAARVPIESSSAPSQPDSARRGRHELRFSTATQREAR